MSAKKTVAIIGALAVLASGIALGNSALMSVWAQQYPANAQSSSGGNMTSGGNNVSIVPGASTLADKAFSPNPLNVKVGDTVTWTNKDTMFHTVTSGTGPSDPKVGKDFDSKLSGPTALTTQGKTFSHTFTSAGEFPYFCQLHPTMVGKVVVK